MLIISTYALQHAEYVIQKYLIAVIKNDNKTETQ